MFNTALSRFALALILSVAILTILPNTAGAQAPAPVAPTHDVSELAKKTQNPVGDLVSVPLQFNFNTGGDLGDATFFNLNFQPVVPFKLAGNWNAIARTIIPLNSVPGSDNQSFSGIGDIQEELFITPAKPGAIIWGLGPALSLPTATAPPLRTGTWAAGLTGVVVKMAGPWVLGGLVTQWWPMSDAGGDPKMDLFLVQPFVNYNLPRGYALTTAPSITANWDAASGQQWTVPLGFGLSKTTVFNGRPTQLAVQYYYNVKRPDGSAGQTLRLVYSLLFPTPKP